jgi:DNA-binding NarL/FixJ family response regulator
MTALKDCILVVDDEFLIAEGFRIQLEALGLSVCGTAATAQEALKLAQRHNPSVVLMDVRLRGGEDGVDAAIAIRHAVGSKVIFITGSREPTTIERIQSNHPSAAVLFKPISDRQLHSAIEQALHA